MRVTLQTKTATKERIVDTASKLFARRGWEGTTTRDLALAAGIATGTLFNYFQSKEAIAAELIAAALSRWQREFADGEQRGQSLEEDIFALVWGGLKSLRDLRPVLSPALDTVLSPLARSSPACAGDAIRAGHLEAVERLILDSGVPGPLPALTMQIYWTLYLGIVSYWAADDSPHQEDTLALLDQTTKLFTASLRGLKGVGNERESE
jgi:AcrR family transcriptional regulator